MAEQVSVVICVKNCEKIIGQAIEAVAKNNPKEIIVIDGNSVDGTREVAVQHHARVVCDQGKGLAYARQLGADLSVSPFVAYVGPDNILPESTLSTMLVELNAQGYVGIQAQVKGVNIGSYWDRGMESNFQMTHNKVEEREVIGTPCIFKRDVIVNIERYDPKITYGADDTDLCLRLRQRKLKLGISTAVVYENRVSNFSDFRRRWEWYGLGDVQFMRKYPSRLLIGLTHPLRNYIIRRSFIAAKNGNLKYIPFFVLCGVFRYCGMVKGLQKLILGKL